MRNTTDISILNLKLHSRISSEAIGLYLAQIKFNISPETKGIINAEEQWNAISHLLSKAAKDAHDMPFSFLLLPEVSLPSRYVSNFFSLVENQFPDNSITIVGLELMTLATCQRIIRDIHVGQVAKEVNSILSWQPTNKPVNACLIIDRPSKAGIRCFLQYKITPSKYEGELDNASTLMPSSFVYYCQCSLGASVIPLSFLTLVCSDMFNAPTGNNGSRKIVDNINYNILKANKPLDFLFNIQYTPADQDEFIQSLRKLYEDGSGGDRNLCTIMLNAVQDSHFGGAFGGCSKVLFHRVHSVPETTSIKQIDASVCGYDLGTQEKLYYLSFERLTRSWRSDEGTCQLHLEFRHFQENDANIKESTLSSVFPMERETSLKHKTYRHLCYRLSSLGEYDKAIEWAEREVKHWEKKDKKLERFTSK